MFIFIVLLHNPTSPLTHIHMLTRTAILLYIDVYSNGYVHRCVWAYKYSKPEISLVCLPAYLSCVVEGSIICAWMSVSSSPSFKSCDYVGSCETYVSTSCRHVSQTTAPHSPELDISANDWNSVACIECTSTKHCMTEHILSRDHFPPQNQSQELQLPLCELYVNFHGS